MFFAERLIKLMWHWPVAGGPYRLFTPRSDKAKDQLEELPQTFAKRLSPWVCFYRGSQESNFLFVPVRE